MSKRKQGSSITHVGTSSLTKRQCVEADKPPSNTKNTPSSSSPTSFNGTEHSNQNEQNKLPTISTIPPPRSVTPWTSASIPSSLPPLPKVYDEALEQAAFTHAGLTMQTKTPSYERLEWVGDAYLYLVSVLLISSTFTSHSPGKCSQIRELLVKNETLSGYARQYGFEKRARLPPEFIDKQLPGELAASQKEKTKVMGDIFEAYVAAVVLSDPTDGVQRASEWLKSLWAGTIAKQIREQEHIAHVPAMEDKINPKEQLAKKIVSPGIKLNYKDAAPEQPDKENGGMVFTVGVYLTGWGETDKQLGFGRAKGKKEAGTKAAEMALANKKTISVYAEMKKVFDEKRRKEKEAAEQQ